LSFGVFVRNRVPRLGWRCGDDVLDLAAAGVTAAPTLEDLFAEGRREWELAAERAVAADEAGAEPRYPIADVTLRLPFAVSDFVDFYASLEHVTNMGRLLRPDTEPLLPNWRHLPVGYHGRAGTIVVSGTDVVRPAGQLGAELFGPTQKLDVEVELGFVVGAAAATFRDAVFGVVLVNDWSARDIQAWEYQPLGPFLGKSFATSISPWVVTLDELPRVAGEPQEPPPLDYLGIEPFAYDIPLEVELNGEVVSRTNAKHLYWNVAQQVAHLTSNGATLRTGDLLASGTISGPGEHERGSLIELTWNEGPFLEDGDEVVLRGEGLGEVRGRIAG
jgi:fumarylacetoacetase